MGDNVARGLALSSVRVTINQGHVFATEQIRDAYFVAHPQELKEGIYIFCMSELQRYENGAWNNRAVLMFTNSEIVNAENVILDKTNFTTILKKYTGDNAQSLFDYIDDIQEFPSGVIYIGDKNVVDSWRISQNGQGLQFSRYQNGDYFEIYNIENSATTDNYYINAPEGRLAYITEDKKYHTLIKSSTDLKGCQLNNVDGRISMLHDGIVASYSPIGEPIKYDINNISEVDGIKNAQSITTYSQEITISENFLLFGVNSYYVVTVEPNTTVRLYVTDKETGNLLAQSCSLGQFYSGNGKVVTVGLNSLSLSEPLAILEGRNILLNAQFNTSVKLQGMSKVIGSTPERFYVRFDAFAQKLKEENMATKEWVDNDVHTGYKLKGDHPQVCYSGDSSVNQKVYNLVMNSSDSETMVGNFDYSTIIYSPSTGIVSRRNKELTSAILQPIKDKVTVGSSYDLSFENKTQGTVVIESVEVVVAKKCTARFYIYSADSVILNMEVGEFKINNNCMQAFPTGGYCSMTLNSDSEDFLMGDGKLPYVKVNYYSVEDGEVLNNLNLVGGKNVTINKVNDKFVIDSSGGSGWDMEVDLSAKENISVISKTEPTSYTSVHEVPYERQHDWVVNEYIEIQTHPHPARDISMCDYFTIKGKVSSTNYTDNSVKFKLRETKQDGTIIETPCVACTESPNVYNKIASPINITSQFGLWCNCLNDPYGYVPNDVFTVDFCTSSGGGVKNTLLFNQSNGLINDNILPNSNTFNEIKIHDVTDASYTNGIKYPSISYDAENFGYTPILSANSGKGMGIMLGNILSDFDIMANAKSGFRSNYFSKSVEIPIGAEPSSVPLEGSNWDRKFQLRGITNSLVGFVLLAGIGTKVNIKIHSLKDNVVVAEKDFSFDKVKTPATPAYALFSDGTNGFKELNQTDYAVEIHLISGSLYGTDFPFCTLVMGKLESDVIAQNSTLSSQTILKTNVNSFIIDADFTNKISAFEDHDEVYCDRIVIPKNSSNGMAINIIGDNALNYNSIGGRPVYIYADINEVGIGNFKDSSDNQVPIYISPNNTSTWKVFASMGYKITPMELPISTTRKSILTNDENGIIDWTINPLQDGCLYLTDKNRIRSTSSGFIFEVSIDKITWREVVRFD